jgi:glutaconate CoA-transferase subunit B
MTAQKEYAKDYKGIDLLAVAAAREVNDGDIVFAGTGLPMLAIMLAQLSGAPNAVCIYEAGSIDGRPIDLPTSVGDSRCAYQASLAAGLTETFYGQLHCGYVDLAFLGGAEIDKYGNVNTTVVGDYAAPQKRFTGSGGNPDINSLAKRTVFIMVQEKRRFKENVDYITSPGWRLPKWPSGEIVPKKEIYGKYYKGGPSAVITNIIEDGRIEALISERLPGAGKWIRFKNNYIYDNRPPEHYGKGLNAFLGGLIVYSVLQKIPAFLPADIVHTIKLAAPYVDIGKAASCTEDVLPQVEAIMAMPEVQELISKASPPNMLPDTGSSKPEKASSQKAQERAEKAEKIIKRRLKTKKTQEESEEENKPRAKSKPHCLKAPSVYFIILPLWTRVTLRRPSSMAY